MAAKKDLPVVARNFHRRAGHGRAWLDLDDVSSRTHLERIPFSLLLQAKSTV